MNWLWKPVAKLTKEPLSAVPKQLVQKLLAQPRRTSRRNGKLPIATFEYVYARNRRDDVRRPDIRPPNIRASRAAARFVQDQGGKLFIWTEDFGNTFSRMKTSTHPPDDDRDFLKIHDFADFEVHLARELVELAQPKITLTLARIPLRRVVASGEVYFTD